MTLRLLATCALVALSSFSLVAADAARCSGEPRECERQIRDFLEGRKYFGVKMEDSKWGPVITSVVVDSSADVAGLEVGDRVLSVNGRDCTREGVKRFKSLMAEAKDNSRIVITVMRVGRLVQVHSKMSPITPQQIDKIIAAHMKSGHGQGQPAQAAANPN